MEVPSLFTSPALLTHSVSKGCIFAIETNQHWLERRKLVPKQELPLRQCPRSADTRL